MEGLEGKKMARTAARPGSVRAVSVPVARATTPKEKFEKKAHLLPQGVLQKLQAKQLRVGDDMIYAIKTAGGQQTINLFKSGDKKNIGETNIPFGKMPSNKYFVASGLILLSGTAATEDIAATTGAAVDFEEIHPVFSNGEFELKIGQKIYMEDATLEVFRSRKTNSPVGYFEFSEPIVILSDEDIRLDVKLGVPAPAKTWMKAILIGAVTGKN